MVGYGQVMFLVGASFHVFLRDAVGSDWKKRLRKIWTCNILTISKTGQMTQCLPKHTFSYIFKSEMTWAETLLHHCAQVGLLGGSSLSKLKTTLLFVFGANLNRIVFSDFSVCSWRPRDVLKSWNGHQNPRRKRMVFMATKIVDQDWSEENCSQAQGFSLGSPPRALGLPCSEFLRSSWWKEFPSCGSGKWTWIPWIPWIPWMPWWLRCFRVDFFRVQATWGHAIQEWLKIFWAVHALRSANGAKLNDLLLSFEILILRRGDGRNWNSWSISCMIVWYWVTWVYQYNSITDTVFVELWNQFKSDLSERMIPKVLWWAAF